MHYYQDLSIVHAATNVKSIPNALYGVDRSPFHRDDT